MKLYTYFRSSAAYRVRIALNLKGLAYEAMPVHLLQGRRPAAAARLPRDQPERRWCRRCRTSDGTLTQSLAILEYLEETHPQRAAAAGRRRSAARACARWRRSVACDIHPLNNLRVLRYLEHTLGIVGRGQERVVPPLGQRTGWRRSKRTWRATPAPASSAMATRRPWPTAAWCRRCSTRERFDIDLAPYPTVARIDAHCAELPAFIAAHPSQQPDAE